MLKEEGLNEMEMTSMITTATTMIEEGFQIDVISFCLTGITLMATVIAIVKTIEQFSKIFKKPVWWIKQNNSDHQAIVALRDDLDKHIKTEEKRIEQLSCTDSAIKKDIAALTENVDKLTEMFVNKDISDIRFKILDVATNITLGQQYTIEQLTYVLKIHDDYTRILHERGLTNGQIDMSIEIIREEYRRLTQQPK